MKNNQTILNLVEVALENGGSIVVNFFIDTRDEAQKIAKQISHIAEEQVKEDSNDGANWFKVENWRKGIEVTIFYRESQGFMIDDIDFGGDGVAI